MAVITMKGIMRPTSMSARAREMMNMWNLWLLNFWDFRMTAIRMVFARRIRKAKQSLTML